MVLKIKMTKRQYAEYLKKVQVGIANDMVNALVRRCPVDEGALRNSVDYIIVGDSTIIRCNDYGWWVDQGTPPHWIFPKTAQALRFEIDGKVIFSAYVYHPGTEPNPWIRNAIHLDLPDIAKRNMREKLHEYA